MAFITQVGNLIIDEDTHCYKSRYNDITKKSELEWVEKDFANELVLTNVGDLVFDEEHQAFIDRVFWGRIDRNGGYFLETPWYRIMTQKMDDVALWRFYKRWRDDVKGVLSQRFKGHSQTVYYIPHVDDFQVVEYGPKANFHFPVWFLDIIIADGLIERYKNMSKPNQDGVRWITDDGVEQLYRIYEARKRKENEPETDAVKAIQDDFTKLKNKERAAVARIGKKESVMEKRYDSEIRMEQFKAEQLLDEGEESVLMTKEEAEQEVAKGGKKKAPKGLEEVMQSFEKTKA